MLNSWLGSQLKRLFDSNDLAWTFPLPPWADARDRQVRRIRIAARAVIRRKLIAKRGRLNLFATSLAWPALAAVKAWLSFRATANPRSFYLFDLWWVQLAHNLRISDHDYFRFDRPQQRRQALRFVTDGENKVLMAFINHDTRPERVRDKIPFAQYCAAHDLPTIPLFAESDGGGTAPRWHAPLPAGDLFLKPAALWGEQGACVLTYVAADRGWRDETNMLVTQETIGAYADRRLRGLAWVLQPCLRNGPSWDAFSCGALCTVRVVTGRFSPDAPIEIIGGFMRFPRTHAVVDNLSYGGLGADYEPATGRLEPARTLGANSPLFDRHPDTGAAIAGTVIPAWESVAALACRAHAPITDIALIGWDVALPGAEPLLVEADTNWGVLLDTPLGDTRYVEILLQSGMASRLSV